MSLPPAEGEGGRAVSHTVHSGYFEKKHSGLQSEASYLAFTRRETFDAVFGVAYTMGPKPNLLPGDAFETRLVVAVVRRGSRVWEYKVEGTDASDHALTVRYSATSKDGRGAMFASPLIVSTPKGSYTSVVFIENGTEVKRVPLRTD
jgi:hypothetical protein